MKDVRFGDV